jgi:Lectin C-type domain
MCQNGQLVPRECAEGFWFDIFQMQCVSGNNVTCDDRTVINPGNPPPPSTTPSPLPPPNTSACYRQADLFDGTTYLKTMCIINSIINYEAARALCHQHNMNLFIIDDSRVQVPFHNQTTELLRPNVRGFVWINGQLNNATRQWQIFHSNGQLRGNLYDGVDWFQSPTIDGRTSGNCLRYTSQFDNPYQAMGVACTSTSWLICEHHQQISTPPTTTVPTTTTTVTTTTRPQGAPNITACAFNRDLFDGSNYVKSLCIVNPSLNYNNARQRCHDIGMNLFIIDNTLVQRLFFNATTDVLSPFPRGFLFINGRRIPSTSQWQVFNSDDTLRGNLYEGVDWFQSQTVDGRVSGDCLRYTSEFGHYQAMGVACTASSWFGCEHGLQTTTPPPGTTTITTTPTTTTTTNNNNNTPPPGDGPNIAACWQRDDLFSNGVYLKSSCIMNTIVDYETAEVTCRYHNMDLFVINSAQEQVAFRDSTNNFLQSGFMWINGMVDDSCGNWFVFDPYRRSMYGGVHWVQTDDIHGRTSGPCLRYTRQFPPNWQSMGVECNERSWFVCEYYGEGLTPGTPGSPGTTTPSTATTTAITSGTTRPPVTSSCHLQADLFDGTTYLKTMCIMNRNINFVAAREACHENNMNLFIIDDSRVQVPFFNATTELLRPHPRGFVWINGRLNNATDQWRIFDSAGNAIGPLYDGVDWFRNENIDGRNSGPCLRYTSEFDNPYQAMGIVCTASSWLVCEHFQRQSSTPPSTTPLATTTTTRGLVTTTPDPTPPSSPNVTACWAREHLRDSNGVYLKSHCVINTSQNYNTARFNCRTLGMDLFVLNSTPVQIAFRDSVARVVGTLHPNGFVWINGRIDDDCGNWYVFDPDRREMWGGVHWVQTDTINGRISGECLRFTGQFPPHWQSMGFDCNANNWSICEFFGEDL